MTNYQKCKAKKSNGQPCNARAMITHNLDVCYTHGGKAALRNRGKSNGNYKHGLYSNHVPKGIKDFYESALANDDALNLREQMAVVDARIMELFGRVENNIEKYKDFHESWNNFYFLYEHKKGDRDALHKAFTETRKAGQAIDGTIDDTTVWDEIHKFIEQRRRLTDSDVKRINFARTHTRNDKILVLIDQLFEIVTREVSNREEVRRIGVALKQLGS